MRPFHAYLKTKEVKKITPDTRLAESLLIDAKERFSTFFPSENPTKFTFENGYESIREVLDALLALRGYKAYSHEALIAFTKEQNILTDKEAMTLDRIRYLRNQSKYYGKQFAQEELKALLKEVEHLYKKIASAI